MNQPFPSSIFNGFFSLLFTALFTVAFAQDNVVTFLWNDIEGAFSGRFGAPAVTDASGNYYRAGFEEQGQGGADAQLQKFDSQGRLLWEVVLNVPGRDFYEPTAITVYDSYLYLCGIVTRTPSGETDFFVTRVSDRGRVDWFAEDQSSGHDVAADLFYDEATASIYLCGTTGRGGSHDLLLAAYDEGGSRLWLTQRDHNGFTELGLKIYRNGPYLAVNGSSETSPAQWDMVSWFYTTAGHWVSEERNSGPATASDQLKDGALNQGFLHLCGFTDKGGQRDFKVVGLDAQNHFLWSDIFDKSGLNDEATALVASPNSFAVAGYATVAAGNEDVLVHRYDLSGNLLWTAGIDEHGYNDRAVDIVADRQGNYLLLADVSTGSQTDVYLYYLEGSSGHTLWSEAVSRDESVNEKGISLQVNFRGEVYVTYEQDGQVATQVYRYSELHFSLDHEDFSSSSLYVSCRGQVKDSSGQSVGEIKYYSFGLAPDYYFNNGGFSALLWDSSRVQRIDFDFAESNAVHLGQVEEYARPTHFNYYYNNEKYEQQSTFDVLAWPGIYDHINAFVSSNSAGIKMTFVLEAGARLSDIQLAVSGALGASLSGGDLYLQTINGDLSWLEPFSYAQAAVEIADDDCITYDLSSGRLKLSSSCGDLTYPYVIQLKAGAAAAAAVTAQGNLEWSTYYGGNGSDLCHDIAVDETEGSLYVAGHTTSLDFPRGSGVNNNWLRRLQTSALLVKFSHDAVVQWATILSQGTTTTQMRSKGVDIYDNLSGEIGNEVHVVGDYIGTLLPFKDQFLNPPLPANAWQQSKLYSLLKNDLFFASFRGITGTRLIISPFGGIQAEEVYAMDISPGGLMYFAGSTEGGGSGSSQHPPATNVFPLYDPGDGLTRPKKSLQVII